MVDRTAAPRRIDNRILPHTSKQEAKQTLSIAAAHSLARRNIPTLIDATCPAPAGRAVPLRMEFHAPLKS